MPYNKGDFTQQGVAGDVSALVRLNEKRVMKVVLSSDDESDNCDISGAVYDLLNEEVYPIGAGVSGNIEITENGENINVAPYATATVNVAGGGTEMLHCIATIVNNTGGTLAFNTNLTPVLSTDGKCLDTPTALNSLADNQTATIDALYRVAPNDMIAFGLTELNEFVGKTLVATDSNAVNCSLMAMGNEAYVILTNAENPSSITITYTLEDEPH